MFKNHPSQREEVPYNYVVESCVLSIYPADRVNALFDIGQLDCCY